MTEERRQRHRVADWRLTHSRRKRHRRGRFRPDACRSIDDANAGTSALINDCINSSWEEAVAGRLLFCG